jgi:hypothetical protein
MDGLLDNRSAQESTQNKQREVPRAGVAVQADLTAGCVEENSGGRRSVFGKPDHLRRLPPRPYKAVFAIVR